MKGQIASLLHNLHSVPMNELKERGIPASVTVRTRADWLQLFEAAQRELFPLLMNDAREWVLRHFRPIVDDDAFMDYQPALINGDLGPYHLLFNPETRRLTGIIDFGTAGAGDPSWFTVHIGRARDVMPIGSGWQKDRPGVRRLSPQE